MANMSASHIDIELVKDLLRRLNYLVQVHQLDDGCQIIFPKKRSDGADQQERVIYEIIRNHSSGITGIKIQANNKNNNETESEDFFASPEYAFRLIITSDLVRRMRNFPIHDSLVDYYNLDGSYVASLGHLLISPTSEDQKKKEGFLSVILGHAIQDDFDPIYDSIADTPEHNVGTGYRLVKSFWR